MLLLSTTGFAQFTLNVTAPSSTTDTCFVAGDFNSWAMTTPLHYVSTSLDGTTKLFSSNTLPASFAGNKNFYLYNYTQNWAYSLTPGSFYSVLTGTSQDVTVTAWKNAINYTFINVTVPYAVSECYFISDQVGWTLPTNAKQMTLKTTNATTKVYSYAYHGTSADPTHLFNGQFLAGLTGNSTNTYGQKTPAVNFTNPGTGNTLNFTVTEFKAIFAPVATALENTSNDSNLIKVVNNKIVTEGVASNVSIFDVRGSLIQSVNTKGAFTSKTLNSGLYIVRVDNKAYKQVVN